MKDADIERARELAECAKHESVTPERLMETDLGLGRKRLHDNPVYRYLSPEEQPHFLFHASKQVPEFNGPGAPEALERSRRHRVVHVISDSRWLMIAGNKTGDQVQEFPLSAIQASNFDVSNGISSNLSNNRFVIELPSLHCTIPLSNDYSEDDLDALSLYLRDEFGVARGGVEVDSDEAGYTIAGEDSIKYDAQDVRTRIDRLPNDAHDEADALAAEANSVDELVVGLDELLENYNEESQTLDDVVAGSSSIEQVRQSVETPAEQATRQAKEAADKHLQSARTALRDANPEEIGNWGLNVSRASIPLAVAAPGSTPLWIAATLVLGGAAGLHSSGIEGSPLKDVDPSELSEHVLAMADANKDLDNINGELAGSLLGAFTYLGGKMAPEEFVKWIDAADPEAILAGANAGAAYANRSDVDGSGKHGAIAGGGLGLLGSYSGMDIEGDGKTDGDTASEIAAYLEELDKKGLQLDE
ncbi:hypothetical protein [Salinigranum marinum]|uniref:hypothetical protein n=1 Tax=Salinigranum marinum TaxID=1515595 RepID=UPI002989C366|nr:hypothetical protein [Salinigranum marinum]